MAFPQASCSRLFMASLSSPPPSSSISQNPNSLQIPKSRLEPITSSKFSTLLQSCIESRSLQRGRELHSQIQQAGFERKRDLLPKLIKLYSVCGQVDDARDLFDRIPQRNLDTFAWTSMIAGYIRNGNPSEAFAIFSEMHGLGVEPDGHTFSALLRASAEPGLVGSTSQLHSLLVKRGHGNALSVANSLIHAYGSHGDAGRARVVFDRMDIRDVVSWTSMIRACSSSEKYSKAMSLFSEMQFGGSIKPNETTIVSVLPACGFFSCLRRGQAVHGYAVRNGFDSNSIVCSALIVMYSRCGDPDGAFKVFGSLRDANVVLWTSMIEGFATNGRFDVALELFRRMQDEGLKPNHVTLVVILSACGHGGLVDAGLEIFETMPEKFGVTPRVEHYACVVDMLGRGGRLEEAERFIERMSVRPNGGVLGTLLGACQAHRGVELGERLAYELFELEPYNAANYVILSNIYASAGRWDDVGRLRRSMVVKGLSKDAGCSWIEVKNKVCVFGAHDVSHAESGDIYKMLGALSDMIVEAGYVASTRCVLLDVEEDDKRRLLCSHSERLAIAFGLLKAPANSPIRIAKNLRVCGDCHDAIKLISRVVARRFIIRDTNRFHHFWQGSCSCGDYW